MRRVIEEIYEIADSIIESATRLIVEDNETMTLRADYHTEVKFTTHDNGTIQIDFYGRYSHRIKDGREIVFDPTWECKYAYEGFIAKLKPFYSAAEANGYKILLSDPKEFDDKAMFKITVYLKIIDEQGNTSNTIARNGFEYCATVVPVVSEGGGIPALVTMAPKYRNSNIGEMLRSTAMVERCDGCGKKIPRTQYIIYYNPTTGEIAKLGTNCAVKRYGYSLKGGKFLERLFMMFSHCSYDDLVAHDPDGFPLPPHMSLKTVSNKYFLDSYIVSIMYHVTQNPRFNIKESFIDFAEEGNIMKGYHKYVKDDGEPDYSEIYKTFDTKTINIIQHNVEHYGPQLVWYKLNKDNVPSVQEYADWWKGFNPVSDWDNVCKTVALTFTEEVKIPSRNAEKFKNILPYTIKTFILQKNVKPQDIKYQPGDEVRDVKCRLASTRYFDQYNSYLIKLTADDGTLFSYWGRYNTAGHGDENFIIKSGVVKGLRDGEVQLSNCHIITVTRDEEIKQREQDVQSRPYPEDKTRLRNVDFKVTQIKKDMEGRKESAIVTDENGCWYYIFLASNDYYGPRIYKPFPYEEGDTVNLTGTVARKEGRKGVYYRLMRVVFNN